MIYRFIEQRLQAAVASVAPDADLSSVLVRPCPDPKHGDYQSPAAMAIAKQRRINPRQLAAEVMAKLDVAEWCDPVEIAGAGFLNFRLKPSAVAQALQSALAADQPFVRKTTRPRTVVLDFSSPNVAKPMHVGHIRSTILGDCLARTLRLLGHRVITDNHIGDWGTQFGMLLVGWTVAAACSENIEQAADPLAELERWYKLVSAASAHDPAALDELVPKLRKGGFEIADTAHQTDAVLNWARAELVRLQQGEPKARQIWEDIRRISQKQFEDIYQRLGVKFDCTYGESFYHARLNTVVQELLDAAIARESEGAIVVFFDDLPELKKHPAIIRKSDGAYNYATTDLATLAYRLETWQPDEIIYVTDARQQLHFQQLFAAFRRWHPKAKINLTHVWFGSILGADGKPFKTRSGETIKLAELLDESEDRAFKVVSDKSPDLPERRRREIARVVGLGAVKYADLLPNRQGDYVFSWDKMLALGGNTAPYLQYAYARIRSIFRKGGVENAECGMRNAELRLLVSEETALAKHLLNFGLTLETVTEENRPNLLCNFLYELAGIFTRFYESCPVLKAEEPERASRLALCELTARVLRQGLEVLGIETLDQM